MGDRYLLIGHEEGLSVLAMFPQEWSEYGDLIEKGPSEAIARPIWTGERYIPASFVPYAIRKCTVSNRCQFWRWNIQEMVRRLASFSPS
jgi:hypothetical protein